jgi:hypothetical protein
MYVYEWALFIDTVPARYWTTYMGQNKEYFSETTLLNRMQISYTTD